MQRVMVGTDIVHLPRLERFLQNEDSVRRVFHPGELRGSGLERLGGFFAAKEAFFKAVGRKPRWLDVEITNDESGEACG